MMQRWVTGLYNLLLGVWVGGLVMFAVGAGITFQTVRAYDPTLGLEPYDAAVLADQGPGILAGAVVGHVLDGLAIVELICAAGLVVCATLQWMFWGARWQWSNVLRCGMLLASGGLLALHLGVIGPAIQTHRDAMYDPTSSALARSEARSAFEPYHKASEKVAGAMLLLLAGACIISPFALGVKTSGKQQRKRSDD